MGLAAAENFLLVCGAFNGKIHALIISCLTKQFKLRLQRLLITFMCLGCLYRQSLVVPSAAYNPCICGASNGKVWWCLQRHKIYIFVVPLTAKFGGTYSGIKSTCGAFNGKVHAFILSYSTKHSYVVPPAA